MGEKRNVKATGAWIPVLHTLHGSPEVTKIAMLGGITEDEVVGILIRLWVWLDQQTETDFIPFVSRDGVASRICHGMRTKEYATRIVSALELVKWARFSEEGAYFPGIEWFTTSGAKSRLNHAKRQVKYRKNQSQNGSHLRAERVTAPRHQEKEKEKEYNTPLVVPLTQKKRSRKAPPDFEPEELAVKLAADLGLDVREERDKMLDHEFGTPRSDWQATFRNWLRNAKGRWNGNGQQIRPDYSGIQFDPE